jgi:hypothetical protein
VPESLAGAELAALRSVTRDYLDGMVYVDESKLRRAFHPKCLVVGHFAGRLEYDSVDVFIDAVKAGERLPAGTPYFSEIASIDIAGDTAVVKVTDDYLGIRFTDYLTMLKHEGQWTIVNKAFYVHPDS